MQARKSPLSKLMAACLVIALAPIVFCGVAFAEPVPHKLKDMNFSGGEQNWIVQYRYDVEDYVVFTDVPVSYGSTDDSVAFVNSEYVTAYDASIIPCGVGDCTIWFCDAESRASASIIAEVKVHVTEAGLKRFMKEYHFLEDNSGIYGAKKLRVEGPPKASYKIKIGSDTYSGSFPKKGLAVISLKSVYKLKTKITYNIASGGVTATWSEKIVNGTDVEKAKLLKGKKKLKVTLENPHKGDVLKIKYAGKTYTKKIKKDFDGRSKSWTIKLKKKMKNNSKFTVTVKNKYKQTLTKQKLKLRGGTYYKYDDEEL